MTDQNTVRVAVLIDADNTSAAHTSDLLAEVAKYGVPTVKRAYGDWTTTQLAGWKRELNRHAITPIQQFAYTRGKNSTDSALIIDAMDLLYSGTLDAFAIVSSDSDFTRLATRLRESGTTVYGLGRRKTPEAFVRACDRFVYLEVLGRGDVETKAAEPTAVQPSGKAASDEDRPAELPELRPLVTGAIESTSNDDDWSTLSEIGQYLGTTEASFDPRNYGFSKLSALTKAQPWLEVRPATNGIVAVRLVPEGTGQSDVPAPKMTAKTTMAARSARAKAAAPKKVTRLQGAPGDSRGART